MLCVQEAKAIGEDELPLTLPPTQDFKPSGRPESPLAKVTDWVRTTDSTTGAGPLTSAETPWSLLVQHMLLQWHSTNFLRSASLIGQLY